MTAKIKLNAASGGGSFSLQAPSSSSNNRVMSLPDTADGTILTTTNPKAGNIIQVQQTVGTGTYSTNSQTYGDVITCAITPSSTSNKIICIYKIGCSTSNGGYSGAVRLARDSTAIYVGAAGIGNVKIFDQAGTFMDSPSTTSAITYRLQFRSDYSGTYIYAGQSVEDSDNTYRGRVPTSLLLMEVAA
jgi:hypothetical protein